MATSPYNLAAHEFLCSQGYTYTHEPASWADVGGPDSGPRVIGGPAYDAYVAANSNYAVVIEEGGKAHQLFLLDDFPF